MRDWRTLKRFLKCPYCGKTHMCKAGLVKINKKGDKAQRWVCAKCRHTTTKPIRLKNE